jgi:hypothetical protein
MSARGNHPESVFDEQLAIKLTINASGNARYQPATPVGS